MARPPQLTRRTALGSLALGLVAGCSGESHEPLTEPSPSRTPTPSVTATPTPSATAESLPRLTNRVSLPALMREPVRGGRIRLGREVLRTDVYTRHEVTYPSGDLTVSGVLLRPSRAGRLPAVVMAHGYIEPSVYVTGQGLMREQDYLARAGFVVLHADYRGHASSDPGDPLGRETRLGYTRDVVAAIASVKRLPYVDPDRVAVLGRSMGGGVVYNVLVTHPGLVRAGVAFAPVSSDFVDNFERWTVPGRPAEARRLTSRFGTPRSAPAFYRGLSARTYFDRVDVPLLLHHGTRDESCPIRWSRTSQRLLEAAGADSRLFVYDGEQHAFGPQWPLSMRRTERFLRRQLGV